MVSFLVGLNQSLQGGDSLAGTSQGKNHFYYTLS